MGSRRKRVVVGSLNARIIGEVEGPQEARTAPEAPKGLPSLTGDGLKAAQRGAMPARAAFDI